MKRSFIICMVMASAVVGRPAEVVAQAGLVGKPITIVSPYAAGGTSDYMARVLANAISEDIGSTVIVENRPGAGGVMGSQWVAKAAADGHTLLYGSISTHVIAPLLQKDVPYDPLKDFTPVSLTATAPSLMVVNAKSELKSAKDVIELAKSAPKKLSYGSAGRGSIAHLTTELFLREAGVEMVHVPYRGDAPALTDLLGGQIDLMFGAIPSVIGHVRSGAVRPIAVSSSERSQVLPDVPTIAEAVLPNYSVASWWMLYAPANMPAEALERISASVAKAFKNPKVIEAFKKQGVEPVGSTPQKALEHMKAEWDRWSKELKAIGLN